MVPTFLLCVWNVASSAKKSAIQWLRNRGKSFMNDKNSVGPKIDPCGTLEITWQNSVSPVSHKIACWRDDKNDLNHFMVTEFIYIRIVSLKVWRGQQGRTPCKSLQIAYQLRVHRLCEYMLASG